MKAISSGLFHLKLCIRFVIANECEAISGQLPIATFNMKQPTTGITQKVKSYTKCRGVNDSYAQAFGRKAPTYSNGQDG